MPLTLEQAERIIAGARQKAAELGAAVAIVVLDPDGHIIALRRMDGAMFHMPEMAVNKAYTAAAFRRPSDVRRGNPFYDRGPEFNGVLLTTLLGGVPIWRDGEIVGALGVAGGTDEQNTLCIEAGLAQL